VEKGIVATNVLLIQFKMKRDFLLDEIWVLTVGASFQRANVYKSGESTTENNVFKQNLKSFIVTLSDKYINEQIDETAHINNIKSIGTFSASFAHLLNDGQLRFGVCQKLLNLYLKYLWCLDILKFPPPHFPVDRIIQTKLNISKPYSWTQMIDEAKYLEVIRTARSVMNQYNAQNLAELELMLFNRRN
jgi:hypothetical protein